jgi:Spy/CpxP family protein refolding chaperone
MSTRTDYRNGYRAGQRGTFDALQRADARGVSDAWRLGFFDGEAGEPMFHSLDEHYDHRQNLWQKFQDAMAATMHDPS